MNQNIASLAVQTQKPQATARAGFDISTRVIPRIATKLLRGRLKNAAGKVIANPGLWALTFGAGGTGNPNTLYFTAGSKQENHGLFGAIKVKKG